MLGIDDTLLSTLSKLFQGVGCIQLLKEPPSVVVNADALDVNMAEEMTLTAPTSRNSRAWSKTCTSTLSNLPSWMVVASPPGPAPTMATLSLGVVAIGMVWQSVKGAGWGGCNNNFDAPYSSRCLHLHRVSPILLPLCCNTLTLRVCKSGVLQKCAW